MRYLTGVEDRRSASSGCRTAVSMNTSHRSNKLLHGYVQRWQRRSLVWDRRDLDKLESALAGSGEIPGELDAKTRSSAGYLIPLRGQVAVLKLVKSSRSYPAVEKFAEHLHYCLGCREVLQTSGPGCGITATSAAVASCATEVPGDSAVPIEYRRRANSFGRLRRMGFIPRVRSGEIYFTELQLDRLDELALRQAMYLGPSRLMQFFNDYIAESGISFGDGTIARAGQFMQPLLGEEVDMPPLGLIYRVLFRCRVELESPFRKPPVACQIEDFIGSMAVYGRILAPQYTSQHALTPANTEHVAEIMERARMLDVVYGVHQLHGTALWPLISHAYKEDARAGRLAAAERVSNDLLARARKRAWILPIPQYRKGLDADERRVFDGILSQAREWTVRHDMQYPVLFAENEVATLPSPPLLCAALFSYVTTAETSDTVDAVELGRRFETFVLGLLNEVGAETIRGQWRSGPDSGDIDAGFVTDQSIIVFECKKSCQSFWSRVHGGAYTLDHFVATLGRGVLQGLTLRQTLEERGHVTLSHDGEITELRLGGREFVHYVLTGMDDGCLQANVFFRAVMRGLYNARISFTPEAGASHETRKRWGTKQENTNRILSKLTSAVGQALPSYDHQVDRLFRNFSTMPLALLSFAATTLRSVDALERCLRGKVAVQNAQAGPHADFYDAYRYARGELSSNDADLIDFTIAAGNLWLK